MYQDLKVIRATTVYTEVHVGNPKKNLDEIVGKVYAHKDSDIIVFPELCMTGYTCADLFNNTALLEDALDCTQILASKVKNNIVVVGLPFAVDNTLYNCAAVLNRGRIIGIVPKTFLPNYKEFYESRWFYPAPDQGTVINRNGWEIPFGTDLLFECSRVPEFKFGVEICEDVWAPISPSSLQAIAGATVLLNLSASNETVAKSDYRHNMIEQKSGHCIAAYVYCSSGPTESTTDLVFGGHCIIAENGTVVAETERFKDVDSISAMIDVEKLNNERRRSPTFNDSKKFLRTPFRTIQFAITENEQFTHPYKVNSHPFIPSDPETLHKRCKEIFNIQVCALSKRIKRIKGRFTIGVSGGLDSTLALLVAVKAAKRVGIDPTRIDAVTMPGFGTSDRTLENANKLMDLLGVSKTVIDIRSLSHEVFKSIEHNPFGISLDNTSDHLVSRLKEIAPGAKDVVFENVQARIRTLLLMSRGFVLGTGDLSEAALGWCTYNGDHMSMYNVNCSVPKTLVKFLVKYVAEHETEGEISDVLMSIVNTVISPELLPLDKDGKITQSTEDIIGPYELHDFFLTHFTRNNFSPKKIAILATNSFEGKYTSADVRKWLKVFLTMFFFAQFKRSCVPDGPKVGSVSLSPRGDWRMPSDADLDGWLSGL